MMPLLAEVADQLPAWLTAGGLLGAITFGLISAYFPPLNAEIYAVAAAVIYPGEWMWYITAMTGGLMVGKITHFIAARKGMDVWSERRKRQPKKPPPVRSNWRAKMARASRRMLGVIDDPLKGGAVMALSGGVGFPPLAVVTVVAGARQVPLLSFTLITGIGCWLRFVVTAWLVSLGISL
ncbi:hypothetical protein [Janibacter sp. GXQ6167]|uniref:hypothetical protein n=1 Tax=Janibacter sp. GXQ6167 TaxID=3240791 RepID=UPI00352520D5